MGIKSIKLRTAKLDGKIEIESFIGKGTSIVIEIPIDYEV
jgi:Histidine kinase-, DNA gyrase B-, and HSP90-like ATPase.